MDLNADGTITLDFTGPKVTLRAPRIGEYRTLRKELYQIDVDQRAFTEGLPDEMSEQEKRNLSVEFHEDHLLAWWRLVLLGRPANGSILLLQGLADDATQVPDDHDLWPIELVTNQAALATIDHWVNVPLASIASPAPTTTG